MGTVLIYWNLRMSWIAIFLETPVDGETLNITGRRVIHSCLPVCALSLRDLDYASLVTSMASFFGGIFFKVNHFAAIVCTVWLFRWNFTPCSAFACFYTFLCITRRNTVIALFKENLDGHCKPSMPTPWEEHRVRCLGGRDVSGARLDFVSPSYPKCHSAIPIGPTRLGYRSLPLFWYYFAYFENTNSTTPPSLRLGYYTNLWFSYTN